MKTPRLLPVVIAAGIALLLFKAVGLLTGGGYVLTGAVPAEAAGAAHSEAAPAAGEPTLELPTETTLTDTSPTVSDTSVTMPLGPGDADAAHGADPHAEPADAGHGAEVDEAGRPALEIDCPVDAAAPGAEGAGSHGEAAAGEHAAADPLQGFDFTRPTTVRCRIDPGVNEAGDALAVVRDGAGNIVPLAQTDPEGDSEAALLERLGERRDALDSREAEIDMRFALVEAAEKRIEERTAALQALEERINALVEEKKTAEQAQFVGIVAMYETMKPREAALILDQLDLPVLLRIARAMNPRKMAPILAAMDPVKAKNLTTGMAIGEGEPTIELKTDDFASLPQIVGQ